MLAFMGPTVHLCTVLLSSKTATGAKTFTLPETLWKSHFYGANVILQVRGEPSTKVPAELDSSTSESA